MLLVLALLLITLLRLLMVLICALLHPKLLQPNILLALLPRLRDWHTPQRVIALEVHHLLPQSLSPLLALLMLRRLSLPQLLLLSAQPKEPALSPLLPPPLLP